jgi:hypothetical protein
VMMRKLGSSAWLKPAAGITLPAHNKILRKPGAQASSPHLLKISWLL